MNFEASTFKIMENTLKSRVVLMVSRVQIEELSCSYDAPKLHATRPPERHLMLPRRHLVVLHRHGAAHFQHRGLRAIQQLRHGARNGLEIVQVALLVPCGQLAEERPPAVHEVRPGLVMPRVDDEELLTCESP